MFILQLLKKEADQRDTPVKKACIQIVDCLVENVLSLEESGDRGKQIIHK